MKVLLTSALLLSISAISFAADPLVSGPQVGQRPGPYSFLVSSGPERGQLTCYVCETAEKPGVIVFARTVSGQMAKLMQKIDAQAIAMGGPKCWLTVLGEKTISQDELGKWTKETGLKSTPTGVFDDPVGPPAYLLAEQADITILMFNNKKVVHNYALKVDQLTEKQLTEIEQKLGTFWKK
ncbi:MAG: hypothetical protein R3B84_24205 [Zavarzinella sp.]